MTVDTIIEGGRVVSGDQSFEGAVAIDDGTIVGLGDRDRLPDAERTIDASGKVVMPGIIDPHVHIDDHVSIDTYETATKAAALGGVTTVIDFAWQAYDGEGSAWDENGTLMEGIERKRDKATDALVDYSFHGGILREGDDLFDEMEDVVDAGVTSFKMYTAYDFGLSNGYIHRVLEELSELGAVGVGHTEEDTVCEQVTADLREEGHGPSVYPQSRPDYTEAMAADNVARMARELDAKYYGIHTSCRKSAEAIERHQADGSTIRGETCTHYTSLTGDLHEEMGNLPRIAPPLRTEDDIEALFDALTSDVLSVVSTDHVAQKRRKKEESNWWEGPFGANGLQVSLPVFHDEAVNERGLSYRFLSQVMSRNPAETFGLPQKGTLEPGTDADIVVFDPDVEQTISAANNASNADYSIYEGRSVRGAVDTTIVRGEVVARDGAVVGNPGHGAFVERELPDWSN
ncbi:dihydropyrimidinase [Haloplanus vescus]|uniref:Dihydropyrimidinase n=1 Tax=Haloplanus vescus TaxID=555874 RepID=A0A1H3W605_9EURY|nr:amidohydrolase family protein [Haloplanus vescus]SDZ82496.1 dihydropyrimidinase [Haloplanus vescus]